MANRIKWGVIGSGGIARRRTIPEGIVAADNAELHVVFDVNKDLNNEVARQFEAEAVDGLDDILNSSIDVVYTASPANQHYGQTLAAVKAGKHILCEKPLGTTVQEAQEMIDVSRQHDVKFGAAFMMRFQTQHQKALRMIQEGWLGKLTYGRAQLSCWYPPIEGSWRQDPALGGGGALMDMGGHCIDLLEMFFGQAKQVSCFIGNVVHDYRSEDAAVATLQFEGGAIATIDTFFCIPDNSSKNMLELYGSKGSILARNTIGQADQGEMVAFLKADDAGYVAQQSREVEEGIEITPEPKNTYKSEIEEFSQAIIDGREPANGAQFGLQSQKVLAACYEAAKTGRTVDIS